MLTDSTSPRSDLQKLSHWLELPETKEVLAHLLTERDKLLMVVLASPNRLDKELDGTKQETLRQQAIGKWHGLNNLPELVINRKLVLEEIVKELDATNQ